MMRFVIKLSIVVGVMLCVSMAIADETGIELGPWHSVGPLKDEAYGNLVRSFNHPFEPQKDALAAGADPVDLTKVYTTGTPPAMAKTERSWVKRAEWIDGYRHQLPRGPAPSRNETTYLYRTIRTKRPVTKKMRVYAEDFVGAWLNSKKIGQAVRDYGPHRYPVALVVDLPLAAGENRLLVKITSMYAAHGFAFGLDGVTVSNEQLPLQASSELIGDASRSNFYPGNMPYASAEPAAGSDVLTLDHALRLLRGFKAEVTMVAMFDPPSSKMDQVLSAEYPPSPGGKAYLDAVAVVKQQTKAALQRLDEGDAQAAAQVIAAAEGLAAMWSGKIRDLAPIAFVRCPPFGVNAIAPYSSAGAEPASICVFDPSRPTEAPRVVFEEPGARIYDMNLSYDAETIFFSAKRQGIPGGWHIYEIGVDERNLKQITEGDCNDISPLLLPGGRMMFVSDRAVTWVQCQAQRAGLLYTSNRNGSGIRKVSANIDSDHSPQILNDGRVLFTRWDYGVEKNVFARHALWTMNPDGTRFELFFGNTIEDPSGFWEARAIPGRPEVVCAFGPHHSYHAGMLGMVWNQLGPEAPRGEGFRFITSEIPVYCDTTLPYGYQDVFPVNERLFLVSYGGDGATKNRLYLIDDRGNRRCIYEAAGNLGCWSPLLLRPREVPPVLTPPSNNPQWVYQDAEEMNTQPNDLTGTLSVQDVYRGIMPAVRRGEAKYLQVIEQVQKSRSMSGGEAWGHTPIIGRGTVHVRRVVGLVPIEADGSAHFRVPALRNISLNVLDAEGRVLMRMGSDMHVMPGENLGCIGCHESRQGGEAPLPRPERSLAMQRPPVTPRQPDWGTDGLIDYQKVVQPVWDRHCGECHGGPNPDGYLDLSGDRTRFFCVSYDNLVERDLVNFDAVFAGGHDENAPMTLGAIVSRIGDYLRPDHYDVEMPAEDRMRVYAWIDANVPYYGTYHYTKARGIGARDSWETNTGTNQDGWLIGGVGTTFERRCFACHRREINNQGMWGWLGGPMTQMVTVSSDIWTDRGVTAHVFPQRYPMSAKVGPELRINLTHPANSSLLQAPLAKEAGGWGLCKERDGSPVLKDKNDPDYRRMWLAIETGKARLYATPRVDMSSEHVATMAKTVLGADVLDAGK